MLSAPANHDEEVARLRLELREAKEKQASAEELLRAIRSGEVDALVVERGGSPAVYSLNSAGEPYKILIEQMADGALTISEKGVILYCNAAFSTIIGRPREKLIGTMFSELADIDPGTVEQFVRLEQAGREVELKTTTGVAPTLMSCSPIRLDGETVYCIVITDVSRQGVRLLHQAIVASSADAIYAVDATGTIRSWNAAAEALHGYTAQEAIGQNIQILIPPKKWKVAWRRIQRGLEGRTSRFDTEYMTKAGRTVHLLVSVAPIRERSGQFAGIVVLARDITERKRAEDEVRSNRAKLEAALASMADAVFICDADGTFVHVNGAFAALHRFPSVSDCIVTTAEYPTLFELLTVDGQFVPFDQWPISRALRGEASSGAEYMTRRRDTGETWIGCYNSAPIRDHKGKITGAVMTARDVTEKKRAEDEVLSTKAMLEAALGSMSDTLAISDTQGNLIHINEAYATFHKFPNIEACPRNISDIRSYLEFFTADGEVVPQDRKPTAMALAGETAVGVEYRLRRKDTGDTWIANYSLAPIRDRHGNITGSVVVGRDVTQQREGEARFESMRNNLAHVGRLNELGQLSAGIAHELNQPLAALLNYSNAAKRLIAGRVPQSLDDAYDAVSKAADQAVRAGEIIRRMRAFVEKRETSRAPDDMNAIIEDAVAFALIDAKSSGITTCLELAPDLPQVFADRVQIQQVLVNLLRNAVEAMVDAPKRELTLSTTSTGDGGIEVAVADTGPGIPKEIWERLFMPFVTTKPGGMGIGLVISQTIVEAHGGHLQAEPNPGGGTRFCFRLPSAPAGSGRAAA